METIPPENRAVLDCLVQALGTKSYLNIDITEFEDCRYCLSRGRDSEDFVLLSFACSHHITPEAEEAVQHAYQSVAKVCSPTEGYQISLQESISHQTRGHLAAVLIQVDLQVRPQQG